MVGDNEPEKGLADVEETSPFRWKRVGDYLKALVGLTNSVDRLERENVELRKRVEELQREVDNHSGQLATILSTLNSTIDRAVESKAQSIAVDTVARLLDRK